MVPLLIARRAAIVLSTLYLMAALAAPIHPFSDYACVGTCH